MDPSVVVAAFELKETPGHPTPGTPEGQQGVPISCVCDS